MLAHNHKHKTDGRDDARAELRLRAAQRVEANQTSGVYFARTRLRQEQEKLREVYCCSFHDSFGHGHDAFAGAVKTRSQGGKGALARIDTGTGSRRSTRVLERSQCFRCAREATPNDCAVKCEFAWAQR